jgi:hypothetical protein
VGEGEWVRLASLPVPEDTCSYAAHGGHLEVLQWARANGCPWNRETLLSPPFGFNLTAELRAWVLAQCEE